MVQRMAAVFFLPGHEVLAGIDQDLADRTRGPGHTAEFRGAAVHCTKGHGTHPQWCDIIQVN